VALTQVLLTEVESSPGVTTLAEVLETARAELAAR